MCEQTNGNVKRSSQFENRLLHGLSPQIRNQIALRKHHDHGRFVLFHLLKDGASFLGRSLVQRHDVERQVRENAAIFSNLSVIESQGKQTNEKQDWPGVSRKVQGCNAVSPEAVL